MPIYLSILDIVYKWNDKTCGLWFLLLSTMSSRFTYIVAHVIISFFLRVTSTPLHADTMFCLSTFLLMDTCVASTFWPLWVMLLWTRENTWLSKTVISFPLERYSEGEFLGDMVIHCLIFWGTAVLFSTETSPFYRSKLGLLFKRL